MIQIVVDNKDGMGGKDYSTIVMFENGTTIERRLNEASSFKWIILLTPGFNVPRVGASVNVVRSDGYSLFSGYVYTNPTYARVGTGIEGPQWSALCTAYSADAAFTSSPSVCGIKLFHVSGENAWNTLLSAFPDIGYQAVLPAQSTSCARLNLDAGVTWAEAAGGLASSTLSAYRVQDEQLTVTPYGQVTHDLLLDSPGLNVNTLAPKRILVTPTDVIVAGDIEPAAYIHHIFQGDGTTSNFKLALARYKGSPGQEIVFADLFAGNTIDSRHWTVSDPAAYVTLNQYGLSCNGGTGKDATSVIASKDDIELCGTLVVEAHAVSVKSGSDGQIVGLYKGGVSTANCFAAFQVSTVGGNVSVQALVNGALCGSSMLLSANHLYLFRIRFSSLEAQRVYQSYVDVSGESPSIHGGTDVVAAGRVFLEVEDVTSGASAMAISLAAESINEAPVSCVLGLYNNVNLTCSIKSIQYAQSVPLEVSQMNSGSSSFVDQPTGLVTSGATCYVTSSDQLTYYPGSVPPSNTLIRVLYRSEQRAVARVGLIRDDGQSLVRSIFVARVQHPEALSSTDCFNAAQVIMACFQDQVPLVSGTYTSAIECESGSDIWPGDVFAISSTPDQARYKGLVQEVKLVLLGTSPQKVKCTVTFMDKLEAVSGIVTAPSIPADTSIPNSISGNEVAGLSMGNLMVTGVNGQTIQIDTGVDAPVNGGFEVRYRDETFGPIEDTNLVLRTSTRNISIPRQSESDAYHIRMYDGLTPPNYSRLSASLVIEVPLQS